LTGSFFIIAVQTPGSGISILLEVGTPFTGNAEKPCLRPNWDVPTRWNSTYHMLLSGLKQQNTLAYFHDLLANKNRCNHFPAENWVTIESLTQLLEVFNTATEILSGVYYPTSPLLLNSRLPIRRTRLTPASLEMCMCLKDHLDAKERKQDKCPLETPLHFEEDVFDDEVQRNKAIPLFDEEIALDANGSSEGTMSPGGPRYDYMMSIEAENDY
nr:hypothetical protein [Tanacetum cinerariifolium]